MAYAGPSRPSLLILAKRLCSRCIDKHHRRYSSVVQPETAVTTSAAVKTTGFISPGELKHILPSMEELGLKRGDQVVVAMSGGVDSSVTLRILKDMPIKLSVMFMRNWDPLLSETPPLDNAFGLADLSYSSGDKKGKGKSMCEWERDWKDVKRVCKHVRIPRKDVQLVDFSKEYWSRVFEPCVGVWQDGGTPNPDVMCNREIKFGALLDKVAQQAKNHNQRIFLATELKRKGHYARIKHTAHFDRLLRAKDKTKDQSYYLSSLTRDQLKHAVLPLANITKGWVRRLANHWDLPTAARAESMGVCFIGERGDFGDFITQYTMPDSSPGNIITPSGEIISPHSGLWHYTIGQRARIPGKDERWFVAKKGVGEGGKDVLIVPGSNNPALLCWQITVPSFSWIHGVPSKGILAGNVVQAQIRHRMEPVPARAEVKEDGTGVIVRLLEPVPGVSPGQVLALYRNTECLGSGVIAGTTCLDEVDVDWRAKMGRYKGEIGSTFLDEADAEEEARIKAVE